MERQPHEHVHAFLAELLDTGGTLLGILENLTDALTEQGQDRDAAIIDVFQMLVGTVWLRFESIPAPEVDRSAELIALALQAAMADLERALELSKRRHAIRVVRASGAGPECANALSPPA
jgi:hypothetical protein